MSGKDFFKKSNIAEVLNFKVLKYGKINEDIAYEISQNIDKKEECIISFVSKENENYIYQADKCFYGTFEECMILISQIKNKKIEYFKKTIDKI